MDSELQYIELYQSVEEKLRKGSNAVMNALRKNAMDVFSSMGFPSRKMERYRYIDTSAAFAPDYGLNIGRIKFPFDPRQIYRCSIPNIGTLVYYMLNDAFHPLPNNAPRLPEGVFLGSIGDFCNLHPERLTSLYGVLADTCDAITAFNTSFAQDGLIIYIPSGTKIDQVIQIVNLSHGSVDLLTNRRTLIVLEKDAKASVLFCEHTMDNHRFLTTGVAEVFVGEGSDLHLYAIDESGDNCQLFENTYVRQDGASRFDYCSITLHGGLVRRQLNQRFEGSGSKANIMGAVVADGDTIVDFNQLIDHMSPGCTSDILYKFVLDGHARGAYAGKVLVRKGAAGTDSHQSNANLCVSPTARMFTQPMLEIYADDVKCNHGSTVGQLDANALYYMAARGIPQEEGRLLLQRAFVDDVLRQIHLVPLRERLSHMVDQRFRHNANSCNDCHLCRKQTLS